MTQHQNALIPTRLQMITTSTCSSPSTEKVPMGDQLWCRLAIAFACSAFSG